MRKTTLLIVAAMATVAAAIATPYVQGSTPLTTIADGMKWAVSAPKSSDNGCEPVAQAACNQITEVIAGTLATVAANEVINFVTPRR